jgi:hypothetical protein
MKIRKAYVGAIILLIVFTALISYNITNKQLNKSNITKEKTEKNQVTLDSNPNNNIGDSNKVVLADTTHIPRITPSTRIVYEYYYTIDDKLVKEESEPPYYYINLTRQQLEEYSKEWQLKSFSEEKVVLRKNIETRELNGYYIIKDFKGCIAVFYDYMRDFEKLFSKAKESGKYTEENRKQYLTKFIQDNSEKYLKEIVDTPVNLLSKQDQENIKSGIEIYGEEELIRVLENYTS